MDRRGPADAVIHPAVEIASWTGATGLRAR